MILLILYYHVYIIMLTLMIDLLRILVWHNTYTTDEYTWNEIGIISDRTRSRFHNLISIKHYYYCSRNAQAHRTRIARVQTHTHKTWIARTSTQISCTHSLTQKSHTEESGKENQKSHSHIQWGSHTERDSYNENHARRDSHRSNQNHVYAR